MSALTTQIRPRLPTSPRPPSGYRDQPRRPSQDLASSYHHALPTSLRQNINISVRKNSAGESSEIVSENSVLPNTPLIAPRPHHLRPNLSTEIAENLLDDKDKDDSNLIPTSNPITNLGVHTESGSTGLSHSPYHQLSNDPDPVSVTPTVETTSRNATTKDESVLRSGPESSTSTNHTGFTPPFGTGLATQLAAKLRAQQSQSQTQARVQTVSQVDTNDTGKEPTGTREGFQPARQPDPESSDPDLASSSISVSAQPARSESISPTDTAATAKLTSKDSPSSPPPTQSTSAPILKMLDAFPRTRTPSPPTTSVTVNNRKTPPIRPQTPRLPPLISLPTVASLKAAVKNIETVYTDSASRLAWVKDVLDLVGRTCVRENSSKSTNEDGRVDKLWKEGDGEGPMVINDPELQLLVDFALPLLQDITSSSPTNNPMDLSPLSATALYLLATLESTASFPSFIPHNPRLAFRRFEMAAKAGCKEAWFALGRDYERFGDDERARGCFERGIAADGSGKEDIRCLYRLGIAHLLGQLGLTPDPAVALPLLHRAADLVTATVPQPAYIYGLILLGEFLPLQTSSQSSSSAISSSQLPPPLLNSITARLLPSTHPTPTSHGAALIHRAAYLRYAPAQYKLGHAYEFAVWPFGLKPRESVSWYLATCACEREGGGDGEAEMALSKWFLCGSDGAVNAAGDHINGEDEVQRDERKAFEYAERAARKGLPSAEFAMGYYHEVGVGIAADVDQAIAWYFQAVSHGHQEAQDRLSALTTARENALSREQHEELTQGTLVRRRTQTRMKAEREKEQRADAAARIRNDDGLRSQDQHQHRSNTMPTPVIVHTDNSGSPTHLQHHSPPHPRKADTMPMPSPSAPVPVPVSVPTTGGRVPVQGNYTTQYSYPRPSRSFSSQPSQSPPQRQSPPSNGQTNSPLQQNRHLSPNSSPRVSPSARPVHNTRSPSPGPALGLGYQGQEQGYRAVSPGPYGNNGSHLGPGPYGNGQVAPPRTRTPGAGADKHARSQSHAGISRSPPLPSSGPQFQDPTARPGFGTGPPGPHQQQQQQRQRSASSSPFGGPGPAAGHGRQRSVAAIVNVAGVAGIGAGFGSGFLSNQRQPPEQDQSNLGRDGQSWNRAQPQINQNWNQGSSGSLPGSAGPNSGSRPHFERQFSSPNPTPGPNAQFARPELNHRAHSNTLPSNFASSPASPANTPLPSRSGSLSTPFANSASVAPSPSASALEFQMSGIQLEDEIDAEPESPPAVKHANKYQTFAEMGIQGGRVAEKECVIM